MPGAVRPAAAGFAVGQASLPAEVHGGCRSSPRRSTPRAQRGRPRSPGAGPAAVGDGPRSLGYEVAGHTFGLVVMIDLIDLYTCIYIYIYTERCFCMLLLLEVGDESVEMLFMSYLQWEFFSIIRI